LVFWATVCDMRARVNMTCGKVKSRHNAVSNPR
jgi:hypothetical protein